MAIFAHVNLFSLSTTKKALPYPCYVMSIKYNQRVYGIPRCYA